MDLFDFMEDFDNAELDSVAWQEQLEDSVIQYNYEYGTEHNPYKNFIRYKYLKKLKYDYQE